MSIKVYKSGGNLFSTGRPSAQSIWRKFNPLEFKSEIAFQNSHFRTKQNSVENAALESGNRGSTSKIWSPNRLNKSHIFGQKVFLSAESKLDLQTDSSDHKAECW